MPGKFFLMCLHSLKEEDLDKTIYIRNAGQTVTDALDRQLAHYASHIGQIIYLGKMIMGTHWKSLSIPRGQSANYNADKFSAPKTDAHFTEEFLSPKDKKE